MICKVCGTALRPHDEVCPKCQSRIVSIEGGVGFWDMLGETEDHARETKKATGSTSALSTQASVSEVHAPSAGHPRRQPRKSKGNILLTVLLCLALIGSLSMASYLLWRAGKEISMLETQISQQSKQIKKLEEQLTTLSDIIDTLNEQMEGIAARFLQNESNNHNNQYTLTTPSEQQNSETFDANGLYTQSEPINEDESIYGYNDDMEESDGRDSMGFDAW